MADLSDVELALATLIADTVYPTGTAVPSIFGNEVDVFRGWPTKQNLDPALAAGKTLISVFSLPGFAKDVSRYRQAWKPGPVFPATITASVTGQTTAAFAGAGGVQQSAGILYDGVAYTYAATAADTPSSVAAALAVQIPDASAAGGVVTLPTFDPHLEARTAGYGTAILELAREQVGMKVTLWCFSEANRDAVGKAVRAALAAVDFLRFPEGSSGRITHMGGLVDDKPSKGNLWVRDIRYAVEYPITRVVIAPLMLFGRVTATERPDGNTLFDETL